MNPTPAATPHRLTRSRNDRMLGGVAGGIAHTYGFDPALVRIAIVVVAAVTLGTGVLAYIVAWLVIPEADADEPVLSGAVRDPRAKRLDHRLWIGFALVAAGAIALFDNLHVAPIARIGWPLLLIVAGAAVLLLRDRDAVAPAAPSVPPVPPAPAPPPPGFARGAWAPSAPGAPPGDPGASTATDAVAETEDAVSDTDDAGSGATTGPASPFAGGIGGPGDTVSAYPPGPAWPIGPPPRPGRPRERSLLGRLTWSALLIVAGVAWLLAATGAASVDARFVLAVELGVVGVSLLVGTWLGRARGLIAIGIVLALVAGSFAALEVPLKGEIGERIVRPSRAGALHDRYEIAIGHLELDLGDATIDAGTHRVVLTDAIGFVEIRVPARARVDVIARADVGSLDVLGRPEVGGTHHRVHVVDEPVGSSGPLLVIDAHVGFGAVKVVRSQEVAA